MHISDLVTTKYVFVFMLIPLTNMSKGINQRWFGMYPKHWTLCLSELFDVAELSYCSADGRRVETILMFTWGTQLRPPGSNHSGYRM
jgi:hypothetical protein